VQAIFWKPLPSLVFGVCSAMSGLLYSTLPETLGQVLPDTIDQAEQLRHHDHQRRRQRYFISPHRLHVVHRCGLLLQIRVSVCVLGTTVSSEK